MSREESGRAGEQAMSAMERQLFTILECLPDPLVIIDVENRIIEWNRSAATMFGWSREEVLGRSLSDVLIPADQRAAHERGMKRYLATGRPHPAPDRFEVAALRREGAPIPVELAIVPIQRGDTWIFSATLRDLTPQKHSEAALRESEQRYRSLFDANPNAVCSFDLEGRILSANDRIETLTGYVFEEIRNQPFLPLLIPENREQAQHHFQQATQGRPQVFEATGVRKDGQAFEARVLNIPMAVDGRIVGVYGIAVDLSERNRAEKALQNSRQQLEMAISAASLCVYEWRIATGEIRLSGNSAMIEGPAGTQAMRTFDAYLARIPDDQERKDVWQAVQRSLLGDGRIRLEHRFTGPEGDLRWLLILGMGLRGPSGGFERRVGVINDITERKRAEEAVRQLAVRAQAAREADRVRVARDVHDELGGVLAALKFALAPDRGEAVNLVDQAIQSFRRIIDYLRPSLLDNLGLWAALEWQARQFSERTGITVDFVGPADEVSVEGELATGVFRICEEVLANIHRHADATETKIVARAAPDWLLIRIRDNGRGITREQITSVNSLGILGIRERARRFGGRVRYSGQPGRGTTVTLRFPMRGGDTMR